VPDSLPARADLDPEELEAQDVAELPNREAMSLIQPGMGLVEGNLFSGPDQSFVDPPNLDGSPSTDPSTLPADSSTAPAAIPPSTLA
jgi:hypothetical protein